MNYIVVIESFVWNVGYIKFYWMEDFDGMWCVGCFVVECLDMIIFFV